jgi:RNA polymerase sigma factor (sigma-70 family)
MDKIPEEFRDLMRRVREGSQDAARELVKQYQPYIIRVVRKKLSGKLRSKFDSDDFAQALWASFYEHRSEVDRFERPSALVAFLARMARNKVVTEHRRYFSTKSRNARGECSLEGPAARLAGSLMAPDPTPSEVVSVQEQLDELTRAQPEEHQRIIELLRRGVDHAEIAAELGLSKKTVQRVMRRIVRDLRL